MDLTKLSTKTSQSTSGGAGSRIRIALKEDLDIIPSPNPSDLAVVTDDFVFKAGKDWIEIWADSKRNQLVEEANDLRFNNGYSGTLTAFVPGDNRYLRQFVNEGLVTEEAYVLIDNCRDKNTLLIGKGECSPVTMKINYDSGAASGDEKGFTLTFNIDQEGMSPYYEGYGAFNNVVLVAADDETPDVSAGTAEYRLGANTVATEITDLDNAVQGSLITLKWTSATNASTITSGATFQLAGAFAPAVGAILVLQATTTSTFAERYRYIPAP